VFGQADPRGRGAQGQNFLQGLQGVMTGSGAMRSYMMRAMGFGRDPDLSYIEMRKRLDAGIYDPQNLQDLFGSFQARGMGEGAMFRAVESVAGGQLKAHQIEMLVKKLGSEEGLEQYAQNAKEGGGNAVWQLRALLTQDELAAFEGEDGGFGGLGRRVGVSAGEAYQVRIENMMMAVGRPIAQAIPPLQGALESVGRTLNKIAGMDVGSVLERGTSAIERVALLLESRAGPGGFDVFGIGVEGSPAQRGAARLSSIIAHTRVEGVGAGIQRGVEAFAETAAESAIGLPYQRAFEEAAAGVERAGGGR
jgi:hypothetical protein